MIFCIVFFSILFVVLNVFSREILWFRIFSSLLFGIVIREFICLDSLVIFCFVNVICFLFLKLKGLVMIVMVRIFKFFVILVMIGVVFVLVLLFIFVVIKIMFVFFSVVCNVL